jgi:acyl-CoA synthetase (AMP-forming)/AMP-acid ligase II
MNLTQPPPSGGRCWCVMDQLIGKRKLAKLPPSETPARRQRAHKMYLTQALLRSVQQHPDKTAIHFAGRSVSFAHLLDRVARLAAALRSLGMGPGERIGMLSFNSDRYLEYQIAVPWGGGVLNPCNIRWSAREILESLKHSETHILFVDEAHLIQVEAFGAGFGGLRHVIYCGEGEAPPGMLGYEDLIVRHQPVPDAHRVGDDLAGIFYTGGTTGAPRGVMLSHGNLISSALALCAEGLASPGSRFLHAAPMFHLADMALGLPHWLMGNTHVMVPAFTPQGVIDAVAQHRVTHLLLVPTMIQRLVDHLSSASGAADLTSLQIVTYGASPMSETLLLRATEALPHVGFAQAYGMTELSPVATINPPLFQSSTASEKARLHSAGRAGICTEVKIVDVNGVEVPRGSTGEVIVRGPNVMQGYWKDPDATAAAVRDGWMHTGDGGYMTNDGFIYIVDRLKDMIITGGENVYSAEVENVVMSCKGVTGCAVIGIPDERWGETVHAIVTLSADCNLTSETLIAHCKVNLAHYKCPRSVDFVGALPLSGAGKVLKTMLRESFWRKRERKVS